MNEYPGVEMVRAGAPASYAQASETNPPGGPVAQNPGAAEPAPRGAPSNAHLQNDPAPYLTKPENVAGRDLTVPENTALPVIGPLSNQNMILGTGKYTPDVGPAMYDWFMSKPKKRSITDLVTWKSGEVAEKQRDIANPPPAFSEFARMAGVTAATLKKWAKVHPDFADYYDACQDIIQEFLVENGTAGLYPGQFAIFAAKNLTKMKDVQIQDTRVTNMKDVLDALEKGHLTGDLADL